MSHAPQRADKLLIKPTAGARPAPPRARTDHSQGTRKAASHPTSHKQHGYPRVSQSPNSSSMLAWLGSVTG
jgi:hypothetical protein